MNSPLYRCKLSETETIGYRIQGAGPVTLVLLHGLAARAEVWTDLAPLFPPEKYTLYLFDLLGSGESSKPTGADYSIHGHSLRLLRFLDKLSLSSVTLVGHSLGGAVVLLAAVETMLGKEEGLLKSIIIMGGPGYLQRLPLIAEIFQYSLAGWLFTALHSPDAWVKVGLRAAYYDPKMVDRVHIDRYTPCYRNKEAKRALVETCRRLVPADREEIVTHYGEIRLPVLLLWGRHDKIVPLSQGTRLEAAIPGARLEVIEECGHNPQEEKPRETFTIMERFLVQREAGTAGVLIEMESKQD